MSAEDDLMKSILGELLPGEAVGAKLKEPKHGQRLVALPKPLVSSAKAPVVGSGSSSSKNEARAYQSRRMIIDDGGIGLGQIENLRGQSPYEDEVEKYLLDKEEAVVGPDGAPLDEFYTRVNLSSKKHEALSAQAPWSRITPPSVLKGGVLGNSIQASVGQVYQVANWIGDDDSETVPITVTLAPVQQVENVAGLPTGGSLRPYGIIQFGTRGALAKATVDIGRGCQFTVSGSQIIVQVGMEAQVGFAASQLLSGMLSFYACVRTAPLTRTVYYDADGLSTITRVTVPAFAKSVRVWRQTPAATTINLDFLDSQILNLYSYSLAANVFGQDPIPVSNDTCFIDVTRSDSSKNVRLIFELSL